MKVRKAIIPAAGLGTRLLPNTKSIPKEMLPLVDKPVLQYIVEEAVAAGVEEILIITNRGKSPIEDYFDYAPDLEARLLSDGKAKEARTVREVADMADVYFLRKGSGPRDMAREELRRRRALRHTAGRRYNAQRDAGAQAAC